MSEEIADLEEEIRRLSLELDDERARLLLLKKGNADVKSGRVGESVHDKYGGVGESVHDKYGGVGLDNVTISRYSRQLILPEIGPRGQLRLQRAAVLIVGAGGLGCPCTLYLCVAGVGRIGVVDYDDVELSNIQRQVLHAEHRVGACKAQSVAITCSAINSKTRFDALHLTLDSTNALEIIQNYDVVVDCTDNVATRYLLNDACVIANKPLVSGSALRFEGQLTVYNHNGGPCYRCLYPKPPPPESVTNCSDGGILGAVTGVIGSLQALEVIKLICGMQQVLAQKLLVFDGQTSVFRTVKLRPRKADCPICGDDPEIIALIDYVQFCGSAATDKPITHDILKPEERVSVSQYKKLLDNNMAHVLLDVRTPVETEICKLPKFAVNIHADEFNNVKAFEKLSTVMKESGNVPLFVVCHRGNDSQKVVRLLKENSCFASSVRDIKGGLHAWANVIDQDFPRY